MGEDSSGYAAVWVWLILTDEAAEDDAAFESLPVLHRKLLDRIFESGIEHWVYILYRTVREQKDRLVGEYE